jgi:hypothetical protein
MNIETFGLLSFFLVNGNQGRERTAAKVRDIAQHSVSQCRSRFEEDKLPKDRAFSLYGFRLLVVLALRLISLCGRITPFLRPNGVVHWMSAAREIVSVTTPSPVAR